MLKEGPNDRGECWPYCVFFKCGKHALKTRGSVVRCLWINDDCIGPSCSFALCIRGKMVSGNRCGLTVRRVTVDIKRPEDLELDLKIKGKLAKRLKDFDDML